MDSNVTRIAAEEAFEARGSYGFRTGVVQGQPHYGGCQHHLCKPVSHDLPPLVWLHDVLGSALPPVSFPLIPCPFPPYLQQHKGGPGRTGEDPICFSLLLRTIPVKSKIEVFFLRVPPDFSEGGQVAWLRQASHYGPLMLLKRELSHYVGGKTGDLRESNACGSR